MKRPFLPLPMPSPPDGENHGGGGNSSDWSTLKASLAGGDQARAQALESFDSPDKLFEKITAKPPEFDWRKAMAGEDPAELKRLERFSDAGSLYKSYREAEKRLNEAGRVRVPGEGATEDDLKEWQKAIGVAEKPDAYEIKVQPPEGYQVGEEDKAILGRATAKVHEVLAKGGKAADVINAVYEFYYNEAAGTQNNIENRAADAAAETEAELRNRWGGKFEENVNWAVAGAKQFFQPSSPDKLDEEFDQFLGLTLPTGHKLGDHPQFLRMFSEIGRQHAEDPFFLKMKGENKGFDPEARKAEILKLRQTNPKAYADPKIQEELDRINAGLARKAELGR